MKKVASIAVMKDGKILMGKRRDNGKWTLPGGHFEPGEKPRDAAVRELLEETGLEINRMDSLTVERVKSFSGKDIEVHAFSCKYNGDKLDTKEDPDQEVAKWQWIDAENFPMEVKNNLHSPKNVTLRELDIMEKANKIPGGLADKKSPKDFDPKCLKAGIKVEMEHTSDPKIAEEIAMDHLTEDPNYYKKLKTIEKSITELTELLKGKEVPVGTVSGNYKKMGPGDWRPVGSSQSSGTKHEVAPTKKEHTAQEHNKQAGMHYEEAMKIADVLKKFEEGIDKRRKVDPSFKPPEAAKQMMDELKAKQEFHMKNMRHHRAQGDQTWKDSLPKRAPDKTDPTKKSIDELNDLLKSSVSVDAQGSAIETANYAIEDAASTEWQGIFSNIMADFNYGDAPREVFLDKGYSINLVKVDEGLYSGYVRRRVDWDGQSQLEENVGKVEKLTIPAIIQYCKAKEFISLVQPEVSKLDLLPLDPMPEVLPPLIESVPQSNNNQQLAEKLIDLLNKLLS